MPPVAFDLTGRRTGRRTAGVLLCVLVWSMLLGAAPASADAVFQAQWGVPGLRNPYDIAADASGNVYVTDVSNALIRKYSGTGTPLLSWGGSGSGDGQLSFPYSVAVGPDGSVYVADRGNNRIQKFDGNGQFLLKWGTTGTGDGQFDRPAGVAVDPAGAVYVADDGNSRVQVFDSSGGFVAKWGSAGTGDGQFSELAGIAVSSDSVYVSDIGGVGGRRIQRFSTSGTYLSKWSESNQPGNLDTDAAGNVFVPDSISGYVTKYSPAGQQLLRWGTRGTGNGQFEVAQGVAAAPDGAIYVADTGNHRIQKFDAAAAYATQWGVGGGEFANPYGIAVDSAENVYVIDHGNNRVQKFTSAGVFLTAWGSRGSGPGQFTYPQSVAVDSQDNVYVTDAFTYRVQKFSSTGTWLTSWGSSGSGDGQFGGPYGVAVGPGDLVYVTDRGNDRVQVFDADGAFRYAFGSTGTGDGQFQGVTGIAVDHLGNVYVGDEDNQRIQKFTADGTFVTKWGGSPEFTYVRGIDVDDDGHVFVADASGNRIQMFDSDGTFMEMWGSSGSGSGQFQFPQGVAAGGDGRVYVTDWLNHRVQRFVIRHALTVSRNGNGSGTVTSDGIDCGSDCSETYDHTALVTLSATPDSSSTFTGWTGACTGTGTCEVTMDRARSVTATFTLKTYALTVSQTGSGTGRVMSTPAGIDCGSTCTATFSHGTGVSLTASPDTGFAFGGWSGDCTGTGACNVSMTQARAVTARFDDVAAPASVVDAPAATTYDAAAWNASCGGDGGLCGTASDNAGSIAAVQWSLRRGTGLYWDGIAFAAADPVFHDAVVTPTGDTTASWAADFPFDRFPATDQYTASVQARDAAGNAETPTSVTFGVDVPQGGSITISHDSQPDSPTSFQYTGDLGTFQLIDDGLDPAASSKTFAEVAPGTYAVQQGKAKQWALDAITCTGATSSTVHLKARTATVQIEEGDTVQCTFAASRAGKGKPDSPGGGPR